jgi:hypothetical protein
MVLFIFELGLVWNWVGSIYSTQQTLNKSNQWNLRIGLWTSMTRVNLVDPSWMNLYLGKPYLSLPSACFAKPWPHLFACPLLPIPFPRSNIEFFPFIGEEWKLKDNVSIGELCGLIEGALSFPSVNYSLKLQISKISRYFEIECAICICIQLLLQFLIHICDFIFLVL